jgi:YD repeat-containing protein
VDGPLSASKEWDYDLDGLITEARVATGDASDPWAKTAYTYYDTKRVKTVTDHGGNVTRYTYDVTNRLDVTTDAEGRKTHTEYDPGGRALRVYRAWRSAFPDGAMDIDSCVVGAAAAVHPASLQQCYQQYAYNDNGTMASVSDAKGNITQYTYDGFDRALRTTFPDSTFEEAKSYNANGNLLQLQRRDAAFLVDYTYDALGRELTHTFDASDDALSEYDITGRMTRSLKKNRSTSVLTHRQKYIYDTASRVTEVQMNEVWQVKHDYDAGGNRTKLTHADGFIVGYAYDALGRMSAACEDTTASGVTCGDASTPLAVYSYNAMSQRTAVTLGNGNTVAYDFEDDGDLSDLDHTIDGTAITHDFGYNAVHHPLNHAAHDLPGRE